MGKLRAIVENGRLVLDEPTELPEGLVLDLVVDDEWDDLDEESRPALYASILKGIQQAERGEVRPVADVIEDVRRRSR